MNKKIQKDTIPEINKETLRSLDITAKIKIGSRKFD